MSRIIQFIDWAARAHFVATLAWSFAGWAVTFFGLSTLGWDPGAVWLGSVVAAACVALIFIAVRTRGVRPLLSEQPFPDAATLIPLFEAATYTYEKLENHAASVPWGAFSKNSDEVLINVCEQLCRHQGRAKPLVTLYGNKPPSRHSDSIPIEVYDRYEFVVEGKQIIFKEPHGEMRFENLEVQNKEVCDAIRTIAERVEAHERR